MRAVCVCVCDGDFVPIGIQIPPGSEIVHISISSTFSGKLSNQISQFHCVVFTLRRELEIKMCCGWTDLDNKISFLFCRLSRIKDREKSRFIFNVKFSEI